MPVTGTPFGSSTAAPGPLQLLDFPASSVERHFDALAEIMRGERLGLVVRGIFSTDAMQRVVDRLERGDCRLKRHDNPYFQGTSYGSIVVLAKEELHDYLDEGGRFQADCAPLFEGAPEYQSRIEAILGAMAGGRKVCVPTAADGRPYMASSIRGLPAGGTIDLHCENETVDFVGMRHLSTVIDKREQLSFYLTLGTPETGGDIAISSLRFSEGPGRALLNLDRVSEKTLAGVDRFPSVIPRLNAGDLLVFNAGRHYHRVTKVSGPRTRWTMGGFLAFSKDHARINYWS